MALGITLVILFFCTVTSTETSPIANTPFGPIIGIEKTANNGKIYLAFLGIPYAKPPTGNLRFAKPEPHPKLEHALNAKQHAPSCIQSMYFVKNETDMSEDCLFLNVYVSKININDQKKILFWIHGGGFIMGTSFGHDLGSFVTDHNIIVVTMNYRLGVLGFLSTDNEAAPGNFGLWDQVMALKWVNENIAAFGGDPDDITISGESAGGTSASLIALTPYAKGLFSKVICLSGTATSLFAQYVNAKADAISLGKKAGCIPSDSNEPLFLEQSQTLVECLRTKPADELIKDISFRLYRAAFVPRVDGDLIPQSPVDLLKDDHYLESISFHSKPYIVSFLNNEQQGTDVLYNMFKVFYQSNSNLTTEEKDRQWNETVYLAAYLNVGDRYNLENPPQELVTLIYEWYERRKGWDQALPSIMSDVSFTLPSFDVLNALARGQSTKVWSLYFNYYPLFMKGAYKGMIHGMDLVYLLDITLEDIEKIINAGIKGEFSREDQWLKTMFSTLIADFINYGDPSNSLSNQLPNGWPAYSLQEAKYLDFNPDLSIQSHLNRDKRKLWEVKGPQLISQIKRDNREHTEL